MWSQRMLMEQVGKEQEERGHKDAQRAGAPLLGRKA